MPSNTMAWASVFVRNGDQQNGEALKPNPYQTGGLLSDVICTERIAKEKTFSWGNSKLFNAVTEQQHEMQKLQMRGRVFWNIKILPVPTCLQHRTSRFLQLPGNLYWKVKR